MEEIILTCGECGHRERCDASRAFMLKVCMCNHLDQEHPWLREEFAEVVDESLAVTNP